MRQRKTEPEPGPELGPAEELAAAESELLSIIQTLQASRTRYEAAQARFRAELLRPTPPDWAGGIFAIVDRTLAGLRRARRDLVPGAPPPESRERQAVRDAESQLAHVTDLFQRSQTLLSSMAGARGEQFHQTVTRAQDNRRAVQLAHQRLLDALRALPESERTQDDRLRMLELQSTSSDELALTV